MDEFVSAHLLGVSRTYAVVVPMLPPPLDEAVGLAYLLMRIVDTLEDAPQLTAAERTVSFARLDAALAGDAVAAAALTGPLGDTPAERALMHDLPEVLGRIAARGPAIAGPIHHCARIMMAGVQQLLQRSAARGAPYPAVRSAAELREYCYYVAGVVGEMLCTLMAGHLRHPGLMDQRGNAVELGTGLQLVNILKDLRKDSRQGRRYLPAPSDDPAVLQTTTQAARDCLRAGIAFVLALPVNAVGLRLFSGLPIAWGALTLAASELAGVGKISRAAVQDSIQAFRARVSEDVALREYLLGLLDVHDTPRLAAHRNQDLCPP